MSPYRDTFGATGYVDSEGFFTEYESQEEADKQAGDKPSKISGETSFFRQRQAISEPVDEVQDEDEDDREEVDNDLDASASTPVQKLSNQVSQSNNTTSTAANKSATAKK